MNLRILALSVLIFCHSSVYASPPPALEWTQYLNNTKLVIYAKKAFEEIEHLTTVINNQLKIIDDAKRQALGIPDIIWTNTANQISDLACTINKVRGIKDSLDQVDEEFIRKYKGYKHWLKNTNWSKISFEKEYERWSDDCLKSAKNCAKIANLNLAALKDDEEIVKEIKEKCETAQGRNAMLQATTMLKNHQNDLLRRVLTLISAQAKAKSEFKAGEIDNQSKLVAARKNLYDTSNAKKHVGGGDQRTTLMEGCQSALRNVG